MAGRLVVVYSGWLSRGGGGFGFVVYGLRVVVWDQGFFVVVVGGFLVGAGFLVVTGFLVVPKGLLGLVVVLLVVTRVTVGRLLTAGFFVVAWTVSWGTWASS